MDQDKTTEASIPLRPAPACGSYPAGDCSAFPSEFIGHIPEPSPGEIAARELAKDYHRVTEEYDRSVCTGPIINGSIRPACRAEVSEINRFARQAYAQRLEGAIRAGATSKQFHAAIIAAADRVQNTGGLRSPQSGDKQNRIVGTLNQEDRK